MFHTHVVLRDAKSAAEFSARNAASDIHAVSRNVIGENESVFQCSVRRNSRLPLIRF
jgi:hypothetical protein